LGLDMVAIQEHKQQGKQNEVRGYKLLFDDCGENRAGGVGFMVSLQCMRTLLELESSHTNQKWVKLSLLDGRSVFVCSAYMPQSNKSVEAREAYLALKSAVKEYTEQGLVVVLGDMNAHVARPTIVADQLPSMGEFGENGITCGNGKLLLDLCDNLLFSANCRSSLADGEFEYTRSDRRTKAVLDYVLVSRVLLEAGARARVDYTDLSSDHHLVYVEFEGLVLGRESEAEGPRRWKVGQFRGSGKKVKAARERLGQAFVAVMEEFEDKIAGMGADEANEEWARLVEKGASTITVKRKVKRRFANDWFDEELRAAIQDRQAAFEKARVSKAEEDYKQHHVLQRKVKQMAKQKKRASWNELTHKLSTEFRAHEKLFFATLGRTLGESSASAGSIGGVRNAAGEVCLDEPGKREAMAGFYGTLGQPVIEITPVGEDGQGVMVGELKVITRYHDEFFKRITWTAEGLT